jgi:hypothetical protein
LLIQSSHVIMKARASMDLSGVSLIILLSAIASRSKQ